MQYFLRHANGNRLWVLAQGRIPDWAADARDLRMRMAQSLQPAAKPGPFCLRPDQAKAGEAMGQQAVAKLQIKGMRIGQHQMGSPGGAMRHQQGGVRGGQTGDARRSAIWKAVPGHPRHTGDIPKMATDETTTQPLSGSTLVLYGGPDPSAWQMFWLEYCICYGTGCVNPKNQMPRFPLCR